VNSECALFWGRGEHTGTRMAFVYAACARADRPVRTVCIRAARPADVPALCRLDARCFSGGFWSEKSFLEELSSPLERGELLVAEAEELVAGAGCLRQVLDEGSITYLGVDPLYRRSGIAKLLVCKMLLSAVERQISSVTLEVSEENAGALGLYTRLGFVECGRRRNYYRGKLAAVIMSCVLEQSALQRAREETLQSLARVGVAVTEPL